MKRSGQRVIPVTVIAAAVVSAVAIPSPASGAGPVRIAMSTLRADESRLTSDPLMLKVRQSIATLDNTQVEAVDAGRPQNPDNVRRVEALLGPLQFEHLFPLRVAQYTYRGLLQAIAKFPAICARYPQAGADPDRSDAICRRTLATMFAHFAQEPGGHNASHAVPQWRQGLVHVREVGWNETMRGGYNAECSPAVWQGRAWPCGKFDNGDFVSYFGRGAKQLSYNYNYGPFSEAMFGNVRTLLDRPGLVADTWLNLASATFFFSYPQPPKPSMLHALDGTWQPNAADIGNGLLPGFGVTTQIINGGIECGRLAEHPQSLNRMAYYREFAAYFGVPVPGNEVLGCKGMKAFDNAGAGALAVYWEQDYTWSTRFPDGKSYACKRVSYQTPYSALKPGDYALCVVANFSNVEVIDDGS
ncbi:MAG TPA: chitinase [Lysobacter sp.]